MAMLGQVLVWLAAAVAVAAWCVAVVATVRVWRILRSEGRMDLFRKSLFAWSSATRQLTGAAAVQVARLNRARLVFFAALLAIAAGAVIAGAGQTSPANAG